MLRRNIGGLPGFLNQANEPSGTPGLNPPTANLQPNSTQPVYNTQAQADSQALLQAYSGATPMTSGGQGAAANGATILSTAGGGIGTALLATGALVGGAWLAGAFDGDDDDGDYEYYEDDDEDPDGESAVSGMVSGLGTAGTIGLAAAALVLFYLWNSSQTPAAPAPVATTPAVIPGSTTATAIYQTLRNL
jgi:hypothetical protein